MKTRQTGKDTAELIRRVREDDQAAFAALLADYEPLVHAEVARHATGLPTSDAEDLRQIALLAFYRAAMGFDLAQCEVEFGLYAKICIANALVSQLRVINRHRSESFDLSFHEGDGGEGDPGRRVMEEEAADALVARIRALLSPYENLVWSLFLSGLSAKEIAEKLKKDPHSVENAVYRIRQKLRRDLDGSR